MRNKTNTARIVLVLRIVEALGLWKTHRLSFLQHEETADLSGSVLA
jgi:hypothetical protein